MALATTAPACAGRAPARATAARPASDALTAADARRLADAYLATWGGAPVEFEEVVETAERFDVRYRDPTACAPGQALRTPVRFEPPPPGSAGEREFTATFDLCPTSSGSSGVVVHVRKPDGEAHVDGIE